MTEAFFGIMHQKLSKRAVRRRDRICRDLVGGGYQQMPQGSGRWLGWFWAANHGSSRNEQIANRVLAAVKLAEAA